MCYFITLAVPEHSAATLQKEIPRSIHFESSTNANMRSSLPSEYQLFLLVSDGCSCDLYHQDSPSNINSIDALHLEKKYKKKGWSKEKIQRAIKQSSAHPARNDFVGFREDIVEILIKLAQPSSKCAVLVHWYNGRVEVEQFEIGKPQRIQASRLSEIVPEVDRWLWIDGR